MRESNEVAGHSRRKFGAALGLLVILPVAVKHSKSCPKLSLGDSYTTRVETRPKHIVAKWGT